MLSYLVVQVCVKALFKQQQFSLQGHVINIIF